MRLWLSKSQHPAPHVDHGPRRVIGRVAVNVSGDADGRVAEHVGDRLDVRPAFEPADRRTVPKGVEADALDAGCSRLILGLFALTYFCVIGNFMSVAMKKYPLVAKSRYPLVAR